MKNEFEFETPVEFEEKTQEELLEEFMDECPATDDTYINVFGAFYSVINKLRPTSIKIFMWMTFNCELDRGRVILQSLNQQRLLKELEISQVAYFKCLRDLKAHDVIRGGDAEYFINPRFMWRGTDKRRHRFAAKYPYIENEKKSQKP